MKKKTMYNIIKYISILNNSILKTETVIADKLEQALKTDSLNVIGYTIFKQISTLGVTNSVIQALLDVLETTSITNLDIAIENLDIYINEFLLPFKDNINNENNEVFVLITYTQQIKDLLQTELDNLKKKK